MSSGRTALARKVAAAFAPQGPLAADDARYRPREVQGEFAALVCDALEHKGSLVVEAGTGVGKTFAYLVPLLLAGGRALVSTATKSLQDQLFLRDLPRLREALGAQLQVALLKGRGSYLCRHRLELARTEAQLPDRFAVRMLARVEQWAQATRSGDLAEMTGLDDRSPLIPLVTSTRENCLGAECPRYAACHVVQARREAMSADLVVINHHLFFADLNLRDSGVAELLPTVDAAVFDEAHQLAETGVQFLGTNFGTGPCLDLARDLLGFGLQAARGLRPWAELCSAVEHGARELRLAAAGPLREVRGLLKLRWDERDEALAEPLRGLAEALDHAAEATAGVAETSPDLARAVERASSLAALARHFTAPTVEGRVRWIDLSPQQARLVDSPLHIRELLREQRAASPKAWIFTSATLGDDEGLSWFTRSAGLEDATIRRLGSPFDYAAHARLWVPPRFPKPNEADHPAAVGRLAAAIAARLGGRTFVLTTTLRALPLIAAAIEAQAAEQGVQLAVLQQGQSPKRAMLERYGDGSGVVLVGSQTFWEGIDIPGDALQAVLIDKLPFPPPNDPLVEARVRQLRAEQRDPFNEYFVAEAAISLKQGAGRLIRSETDRGLLVVCDPRMRQMGYGQRLRAALPPMGALAGEAELWQWVDALARR